VRFLRQSSAAACVNVVEFIDDNGGGPGVRLRKPQPRYALGQATRAAYEPLRAKRTQFPRDFQSAWAADVEFLCGRDRAHDEEEGLAVGCPQVVGPFSSSSTVAARVCACENSNESEAHQAARRAHVLKCESQGSVFFDSAP
jgi:hypothetical protein